MTPDTITLRPKFDFSPQHPHLQIISSQIGSKTNRDILQPATKNVQSIENDLSDRETLCVTKSECHQIAEIVTYLEWIFGGVPQDVEWTFDSKNTFYVLQSRPVTTISDISSFSKYKETVKVGEEKEEKKENIESEEEKEEHKKQKKWNQQLQTMLKQDPSKVFTISWFNTPTVSRDTWVTTYNIGEMFPSAATPLSLSTFGLGLELGLQDLYRISGGTAWPQEMAHAQRMVFVQVLSFLFNLI